MDDLSLSDMWGDVVAMEPVSKPRVAFSAVVAPAEVPDPVRRDVCDLEFGFGAPVFYESILG